MQTRFAPPERLTREDVAAISLRLKGQILLPWFDAVPVCVLVINQHRQIVYCNAAFRTLAQKPSLADIIGLRPGEALGCIHAAAEEAGCGCSDFCSVCGAAQAILRSLRGEDDCQVCRMLRVLDNAEAALDLEVHTKPIEFEGAQFVLFTALDISHEKRLRYLDRTFHHDLINLAGGMASLTQLMDMQTLDAESAALFADCTRRLLREVLYHRDVSMAEQGRLTVNTETIPAARFLERLTQACCDQGGAVRPRVRVDCRSEHIKSDKRILGHVLRNMLRNALEACTASTDEVLVSCTATEGGTDISVHNPGCIPPSIRKQLFKRYVSTKGEDRGLGTYVMRLLAEHYLGGSISFDTDSANGTTFTLHL
ncbi:MAG: hypothetical protein C0405_05335 [Desulfovibrio sp.]|nr:hypothetical protein [Desulfovibrio sp.]